MAIIDDSQQHDLDSKQIQELKTIDINDSSLPEGKEETINPNADAWERACPPPDGVYLMKLHEAKIAYQQGKTEEGEIFYVANLEMKIQENPDWKDVIVYGKVSTYIGAGKEISTMAGLIRKFGVAVQTNITHLALIKLMKKCLSKEPKLYVEGEWKVWDMPKGEWIKQGMKNFPKMEDGSYNHVIRDSKGNTVTAKFKVTKWWTLKDYREFREKEKTRKAQQQNNRQTQSHGEMVDSFQEIPGGKGNSAVNPGVNQQVPDEDFVIEE